MCQLLALAFNEPVTASLSFRGFRHGASDNPDGWGLATFDGSIAKVVKEPCPANKSGEVESIINDHDLTSKIFIGHVRHRSVGRVSKENTHPFVRRFHSRDIVLVHNGKLGTDRLESLIDSRYQPDGDTDSELALCVLITWMIDQGVAMTDYVAICDLLRKLNGFGKMSLLFSDGEHLCAYHDAEGRTGLCFTRRASPFSCVTLRDEDWTANLPEDKSPNQRGYVIATRALTEGEQWTNFERGALMVFKDGEIVYVN